MRSAVGYSSAEAIASDYRYYVSSGSLHFDRQAADGEICRPCPTPGVISLRAHPPSSCFSWMWILPMLLAGDIGEGGDRADDIVGAECRANWPRLSVRRTMPASCETGDQDWKRSPPRAGASARSSRRAGLAHRARGSGRARGGSAFARGANRAGFHDFAHRVDRALLFVGAGHLERRRGDFQRVITLLHQLVDQLALALVAVALEPHAPPG